MPGSVTPATYVLVHGGWHGSWCWDHVAAGLEDAGHKVVALTLPGHDRPGTRTRIWNRMSEYVDAIAGEMENIEGASILVGHSMGGYATQLYLEKGRATRAVLVASVPAAGTLRANLRVLRRHPWPTLRAPLTADYSTLIANNELVRELFFTASTPDAVVADTHSKLQNESALALNFMVVRRAKPKKVTTPVSVVAGLHDQLFTVEEQKLLAAAYGTEPEFLDGGHDLMLEPCWPQLVESLLGHA